MNIRDDMAGQGEENKSEWGQREGDGQKHKEHVVTGGEVPTTNLLDRRGLRITPQVLRELRKHHPLVANQAVVDRGIQEVRTPLKAVPQVASFSVSRRKSLGYRERLTVAKLGQRKVTGYSSGRWHPINLK